MGEIIKIRGVEFDTGDEMDMMLAESFRNNDKDVIFGYEFAAYGRRVRNRKPKWRRLDKNTWVKWTGKSARNVNTGETSPILIGIERQNPYMYRGFSCGAGWIVWTAGFIGYSRSDVRRDSWVNTIGLPDAWEICDE